MRHRNHCFDILDHENIKECGGRARKTVLYTRTPQDAEIAKYIPKSQIDCTFNLPKSQISMIQLVRLTCDRIIAVAGDPRFLSGKKLS